MDQVHPLTLEALLIPGESDALAPLLRAALGGDINLNVVDAPAAPDGVADSGAPPQALVLGPGAEEAVRFATAKPDIRFVQFTGCRPPSAAVVELLARGVVVADAGPALAPFVADHALDLVHAGLRLAGRMDERLDRMTAGIVGFGNAGFEIARRLRSEGATIVYHDIRTAAQGYATRAGARRLSLDRLLVASDVVSIHVNDTPHTSLLISARELRLMKAGAVLVNTSVAEAVDEDAVRAALDSGSLGAVALGVVSDASRTGRGPLAGHDKVLIDPREATGLRAALEAVAVFVADNLERIHVGEEPRGLVDPLSFPAVGDPAFWSSRLAPRRPV